MKSKDRTVPGLSSSFGTPKRNSSGTRQSKIPPKSEGELQLRDTKKSARQLALLLGVGKSTVARWLTGQDFPSRGARLRLEGHLGISFAAWDKKPGAGGLSGTTARQDGGAHG